MKVLTIGRVVNCQFKAPPAIEWDIFKKNRLSCPYLTNTLIEQKI
jgi:hypothetical protein